MCAQDSVLASVENEQGIEVFGTDAIVNEYRNEFIERLQPASIDEELSLFEKETLRLSELCVEASSLCKTDDFTEKEYT